MPMLDNNNNYYIISPIIMVTETKRCRICYEEKSLSSFLLRTDSGKYRTECNDCRHAWQKKYRKDNSEKIASRNKFWRESHAEELRKYMLEWQRNNRDKCHAYNKKYADNMSNEQKKHRNELAKKYREEWKKDSEYLEKRRRWNVESSRRRRKSITAYEETRKKNDPIFKLKKQIRNEIRNSFRRCDSAKRQHTEAIVGCSLMELYRHLTTTYEKRYDEEYVGQDVHIDHIIPLSTAKTEEDIIKLCHYKNLQLLKPIDNLLKSDKIIDSIKAIH